jgi:multiple antibiotic resistance protein
MDVAITIKFVVAMIVMMNPLGSLSIFLQLTNHQSITQKRRTALVCGFSMIIIMLATLWVGKPLLDILGISIPSFRFAGGIILLLMGLSMLQSHESAMQHTEQDNEDATERDSIAVVPLALPVIIGPGAISTIIIMVEDYSSVSNKLGLSIICCCLAIGMAGILYYAYTILQMVGKSIVKVVTRIMGMMVTAIAVGMLANGLIGLLPVLGGA